MEEEALNTSIEETNPPEKFVDGGAREKQDYFETRINQPGVSTENLFHLHGAESFNNFKSKDDYWDNEAIQNKFVEAFGTDARYKFDEAYDNSKQEFSNFKMGKFQSSKSGYELIRDDLSDLRSTVRLRHTNMAGTVMMGTEWSNPTKDYRENFNKVRVKSLDDEGNEVYTIKDYSPELLEELEEDDSFGGLAYSDSFYNIDPNEGVDGLYYEAIYDGKIHDALSDSVLDVRNDQIVSRWDIDTGTGMFDDIFKNNKLEADGVLDYAKLLVKAPMNMAFNMMDTAIQLGRAATAGTNALFNMVREEDLALDSNSFYKMLTTAGIKMKGHNTSLSREALEDGFFGSMEAFLSTTADIALQVALAGGLGRAGAGLSGIMTKGMAPKAIQQAEKRAAEVFVRGTLTSMAAKDSYNEALENGFTTTEASLITGGMVVALWKATKYAGYLFGEYEAKLLRENVKKVVSNEQKTFLQRTFKKITEGNLKKGLPADTGKGLAAFASGDNAVTRVFGKIVKGLPSKKWVYAARQEGLEEMTEELFQDGVKHAASAYGVLINNAKEARKGRYLSIFDEGYFIDAAERYATSGLAGAMGGPMGIAMTGKVDVSTISSTSTLADIILSGNKSELVSVLKEMKTNGELGPDSLSTEYNIDLDAFEPLVEKSGAESLSDMVYNTYLHDINVVDTFINTGMMAQAKTKLELDDSLKEFVDTNAMRKDLASLMGNLLDFHTNKGVSISIYTDLDKLNDVELAERIPEIIEEFKGKVDKQREELKELKEKLKAKTPTVDEDEDGTDENPKVKKKEKVKSAIDGKADKIARLEAEIELSKNVTKGDLKQMLSDYRKVRAIATGAASEYYLLQNEFADDAVLGAMYKRKKEHEILGDHPFRDMLFSMRIRSIKDEKNHLLKIKKSEDSEARILAYKTLEEGDMDDLLAYVKKNGSTLSEKALKHIVKLRDKLDFTEANEAFNIKNDDSIFDRDADGKVIEKDMNQLFLEVLAADPFNKDILTDSGFYTHMEQKGLAKKFFRQVASKGINNVKIPVFFSEFDRDNPESGKFGYKEMPEPSTDAITGITKRRDSGQGTDNTVRLIKALNTVGAKTLDFRTKTYESVYNLATNNFFKAESFKRRNINAIFKDNIGADLTRELLIDKGLSQVNDMIAGSDRENGIFTKSDTAKIDDVLEKMEVREAVADVLTRYMGDGPKLGHYINMMASFRKTTMDIIDFKYDPDAIPNSDVEEHPYKDYTVMSDFFTDFIFDPLLFKEAFNTDPKLRDENHLKVLNQYSEVQELTNTMYVTDTQEVLSGELDTLELDNFLNAKFENLSRVDSIEEAVEFFNTDHATIQVPSEVIRGQAPGKMISLGFRGMTKMKASKWLLQRSRDIISKVKKATNPIPYKKQKEADAKATFRAMRNLIEDARFGAIKKYIEDNVDGYRELISSSDPQVVEIAQMNIKLENILYQIYNKKIELNDATAKNIYKDLDSYVGKLNQKYNVELTNVNHADRYDLGKEITVITGALTTDFTSYYSKFKGVIMNKKTDAAAKIVTAAQEFSAKYAAAYVFSNKFKRKVDSLTTLRDENSGIRAIFISGTAGSGKTTAVINLGMQIGIAILKDRGVVNTAVLPVSNHKVQIDNLAKNIGSLAEGNKGMGITDLNNLLTDAIYDKEEALERVNKLGVIVIDEVTYMDAIQFSKNEEKSDLLKLDELITKLNFKNPNNTHPLTLVIMGDQKQSSNNVVRNGSLFPTSIQKRSSHFLPYMNFSFRSRNSFLVDSIATISKSISNQTRDYDLKQQTEIILERGTKYGTTGGKYYGLNLIDEATKNTGSLISNEFVDLLNDKKLAKNIEDNIKKVQAFNATKAADVAEMTFKVLIVPQDLDEFNSGASKGVTAVQELMNRAEYKDHFQLTSYKAVGGAEANYVLAELPLMEKGDYISASVSEAVSKGLNTIATRAFDFTAIVNRESLINVKHENTSEEMPDGMVIIPTTELDSTVKTVMKNLYLDILKDVKEEIIDSGEEVESVEGDTIIPPEDTGLIVSEIVKKFTERKGILDPVKALKATEDSKNTLQNEAISNILDHIINMYTGDENATDMQDQLNGLLLSYKEAGYPGYDVLSGLGSDVDTIKAAGKSSIIVNYLSFFSSIYSNEGDFTAVTFTNGEEEVQMKDVLEKATAVIDDTENMNIKKQEAIEAVAKKESQQDQFIKARTAFIESLYPDSEYSLEKGSLEEDLLNTLVTNVLSAAKSIVTIKPNPDIDVKDGIVRPILKKFKTLINIDSVSIGSLNTMLKQFKDPDNNPVTFPKEISKDITEQLLGKYSRKSVYDALSKIVVQVKMAKVDAAEKKKKKKVGQESSDTKLKRLKKKVGIDSKIMNKIELFNAIQKLDESILHKINRDKNIDLRQEIKDLEELKALWYEMFAGYSGLFSSHAYGTGFYNKGLDHKETLEDYKDRYDKIVGKNDLYTIPVNDHFLTSPYKLRYLTESYTGHTYEVLNGDEALDRAFNFSGASTATMPDSLELRVIKDGNDKTEAFIVAVKKDVKYIVSKIDTSNDSVAKNPKLKAFLDKMDVAIQNKKAKPYSANPGIRILDLPLEGNLRNFIKVRAGKIIKSEDVNSPGTLIDDLKSQGLNIADIAFVSTEDNKGNAFGSEEVGNVRGESFMFYSKDNSKAINVDKLAEDVKGGQILGSGRYILNEGENIDVQLGVLPLKIANDMEVLADILRNNNDVKLGEYPSHFSMALQKYFSDYAAEMLGDADEMLIDMKIGDPRMFTREHATEMETMGTDLEMYFAAKESKGETEVRTKVMEVLDKMKGEDSLSMLENLAKGYIHSRISGIVPGKKAPAHLISKNDKFGGAYIFRINSFLKTAPDSALKQLTTLTNVANYNVKPNSEAGNTVYAATLGKDFLDALKPLLYVRIEGVESPTITITERGNAAVDRAIDSLDKIDVTKELDNDDVKAFNTAEVILGDSTDIVSSIAATNRLINMSEEDVDNAIDSLNATKDKIKGDPAYTKEGNNINKALKILSRWKLNRVGKDSEGNEISSIFDVIPEFITESNNGVIEENERIKLHQMFQMLITSITVDYSANKMYDTEIGMEARETVMEAIKFADELEDGVSAEDYMNEFIQDIKDNIDVDGITGIVESLERCNF